MKQFPTRTLVLVALFAAVSIILSRFFVFYLSNSVRISFGMIPVILISLLAGPLAGAFTGGVADILGAALFSPLGWYPPLTISPVLFGVFPALLKPLLMKKVTFVRVYLVVLLADVFISMGLTTYLLSGLYGTGYLELLAVRVPVTLAVSVCEGIVVYILYKRLRKETLG